MYNIFGFEVFEIKNKIVKSKSKNGKQYVRKKTENRRREEIDGTISIRVECLI